MTKLLLLGPPAVGKTTIAKLVFRATSGAVQHCAFDSVVEEICKLRSAAVPISHQLIDDAAHLFLRTLPTAGRWIIEFTHHDYVALLEGGILNQTEFSEVVVLTAAIDVLASRNHRRENPVPDAYLRLCSYATARVLNYLELVADGNVRTYATDRRSPVAITEALLHQWHLREPAV